MSGECLREVVVSIRKVDSETWDPELAWAGQPYLAVSTKESAPSVDREANERV